MRALIIDTETSGLFNYSKGAHEEGQPYLASISALLLDERGEEVGAMHRLIKPTEAWGERALAELKEGLGAFAKNGLTYDQLMSEGCDVQDALADYNELFNACEGIAGFNVSYDLKVMRGALRRNGMPDRFGERPTFCVMRGAGEWLKRRGIKLGKVPNLSEAVLHLLGREHAAAHTSLADTAATADMYRMMLFEGRVEWKEQVSKKGNGDE